MASRLDSRMPAGSSGANVKKYLLRFLLPALLALAGMAQAATYSVTSANYTNFINFTPPCVPGITCADYAPTMHFVGTFDVATLAPNLANASITPTAFSFNDGINTYASSDADVRVYQFTVTTDAGGNLTDVDINLEKWQSAPHAPGAYWAYVQVGGGVAIGHNNVLCGGVGVSPAGVADSCVLDGGGVVQSRGWDTVAPTYALVAAPATVPTLSQWAQIILVSLMTLVGLWQARRLTR